MSSLGTFHKYSATCWGTDCECIMLNHGNFYMTVLVVSFNTVYDSVFSLITTSILDIIHLITCIVLRSIYEIMSQAIGNQIILDQLTGKMKPADWGRHTLKCMSEFNMVSSLTTITLQEHRVCRSPSPWFLTGTVKCLANVPITAYHLMVLNTLTAEIHLILSTDQYSAASFRIRDVVTMSPSEVSRRMEEYYRNSF